MMPNTFTSQAMKYWTAKLKPWMFFAITQKRWKMQIYKSVMMTLNGLYL